MPVFKWEGKTRTGDVKRGTMSAPDEEAVMLRLKQQQIIPSSVKKGFAFDPNNIQIPGLEPKVKPKSLIIFTRNFATMIDAGLPLVQGLEILAAQNDDPVMKKALFAVKNDVETGSTFASSLEKHPKIFDQLYISLVSAGELGGILDTILNRLATYIEKAAALQKRVKGALTYPITILVIAIAVLIVLMVYVVPTFAKMMTSMGSKLPGPTQLVMDISQVFQNYLIFILGDRKSVV